ncbi:helix-turn-helix and ligand-binding sensor domain-containing protein [Costertonia aggregata]|uniref:LuxR family transcriptional regulator n=1 Tax=Costertonia aggregata TaxID=343403 RepID=A0A7H9ARY8_9FLAO|nr:LuxR C-terminal-related transcriptional regulator [Costertonia aggregata]QLG46210.1 LuxR family transcriptional regulator [Costertonia aggregata]
MRFTYWLSHIIVFSLFFAHHEFLKAQEMPPVQNFYPKDYHAENQNWAISQSSNKLIYVANSKGLLEYNGADWGLYPSPNESILRSVKVVDNRIYTGCFMEFGYWEKNKKGTLCYTSLSQQIGIELIEDEEFWNIIHVEDWIVFQSLKRIYVYNIKEGLVSTIDSDSTITKIFKVGGDIYFQRINKGIFKIEYGMDSLVLDADVVKNDEVINIFENGKEKLILTQDNGFYSWKDTLLTASEMASNDFLKSVSFYDGIQLTDNSFVLGTISNGLIYLNENREVLYTINQNKGLPNNTVLSVFEDAEKNIWLGLDNGISYININAPIRVYNDNKGILGSVYTSAVYKNNLYLGTNQGLFYKELVNSEEFIFIKGTQGQVWSLSEIDGTLFCGHNSGTFIVDGNTVDKIANIQGTWGISKLDEDSNTLLQGNYDGLYVLEKTDTSFKLKNKIEGFDNSSRYFEKLGSKIFVNHEYNGVFELDVDSSFTKVKNVIIDNSIKGSNSGIVKYNEQLLYSYKKGIFEYSTQKKEFVKDSFLSQAYTEDEYESGKLIFNKKDNILWIFTNSNISYVSPAGLSNTPKIKSIPLTKEIRKGILGYENITKLNDNDKYLIGTTSGYFTVDVGKLIVKDFEIHIAKIKNSSNKNEKLLHDKILEENFDSNDNNLEFSYYVPEYNKYLVTYYQSKLEGIYDDWSTWSKSPNVVFKNLPFGEYTFKVRSKIGDTISKNTASYSFTIEKPWYISNIMIAIYILCVLLFSFLMHTIYKRHYRKQREKLVYRNKKEMELAKLQNEKEIIRIKNEKLELEFKGKSKELAVSTMSIIKKNELLIKIKEELNTVEDTNSIEPVIHIIDQNLKQNNNWELFQEAFNNADSGFLKKIKTLHSTLSPNDLKLCAYLRLNLSSKEVAQLLNISPRSVEIKRYRLRKKLNLKHEDNLVNYILEL